MLVRRTPLGARFRTLSRYCQERDTLSRSCKTALVVGTVLGVINHGPALLSRQWTTAQWMPLLITYLVPFTVVMYGQIQGERQRDQARAEPFGPVHQGGKQQ